MNLSAAEALQLVRDGEGKNLEFKRGLPGDAKVARTLCAFSNTRGGLLLIGVGDRGEIVGAPRPRETMDHLRAVAAERLEPAIEVQVGTLDLGGKRIVWCSVPISPVRPHAALDDEDEREFVVRVGASNRRATGATLGSLRAHYSSGAKLDDLQRKILHWLEHRRNDARAPAGDATVAEFAKDHNVGKQRARRAFTELELAGRLVAHGSGMRRAYALP